MDDAIYPRRESCLPRFRAPPSLQALVRARNPVVVRVSDHTHPAAGPALPCFCAPQNYSRSRRRAPNSNHSPNPNSNSSRARRTAARAVSPAAAPRDFTTILYTLRFFTCILQWPRNNRKRSIYLTWICRNWHRTKSKKYTAPVYFTEVKRNKDE